MTITIGGNDVFSPVVDVCILVPVRSVHDDADTLAVFETNLVTILGSLREAAGPDTTIVVTAYANPLIGQQLPFGAVRRSGRCGSQGGPPPGGTLPAGLNARHPRRWQIGSRFASLTRSAGSARAASPTDCLHPDQSGYDIYTGIFADTILG